MVFTTVLLLLTVEFSLAHRVRKFSNITQLKTLEEIARENELTAALWNFTERLGIFNSSDGDEECLQQVNENPELIGPYLVNRTLNGTKDFITEQYLVVYRYSRGNEIQEATEVHDQYKFILDDQQEYINSATKILENSGFNRENEWTCVLNSSCACIYAAELAKYERELWIINECDKEVEEYLIFGKYVDPALRISFMAIGLALNVAVIFVAIREKSIRSEYNSVIINLVLNDLIMLAVFFPIGYFDKYHRSGVQIEYACMFVQVLVVSASSVGVLTLNLQRFFDVSRALKPSITGCRTSPVFRVLLYTSAVWAWSMAAAVSICHVHRGIAREIIILMNFLVYTLILSVVLVVVNSLTARKLQRAAERERTTSELEYITDSGVVFALTMTFYVFHVPHFIFMTFEAIEIGRDTQYYLPYYYRIVDLLLNVFFMSYPISNVIVLYKSSGTYRRYLRKYFFRCWFANEKSSYLTMSSLQQNM